MSKHRWTRVGMVAAVAAGSLMVGGGAAHAGPEPPCVREFCEGLNPVTVGCNAGAVVVNKVVFEDNAAGGTFGKLVVRLMYSPTCDASWARVTAKAGGTAHVTRSSAWMGAGHRAATKQVRDGHGSIVSKMTSGSSVIACGKANFNEGAVVEARCTSAG